METYSIDTRPTVLLIDGAHALRRAMYQPKLRELSNSRGVPTGAIFGFMNIIQGVVTSMNAQSIIVCWEGGHSERRLQVYEEYKHKDHDETPLADVNGYTDYEYYCHQLSWIKQILDKLGIHQLRVEGKEGDDVLYRAAQLLEGKKIIISEDKDFYTLVSEDVSVYRPIKKEYVDLTTFEQCSGGYSTAKQYLYAKALEGDGSDNIPSVAKGVGPGTISTILMNIPEDELSPDRILKEAATIGSSRCMKLVAVGRVPIVRNLDLVDISREPFDVFQLQSIVDELSTQRYPEVAMVHKLLGSLEFSDYNVSSMIAKLSAMSEYSLAGIIDKDYIKSAMMGGN